jgi:TolA-binding protein
MSDLTRQQLKRNELADLIVAAVTWIKNNRNLFLSIAGTASAVLILGIFFFTRYYALTKRANDKLAIAQGFMYRGQNNEAVKLIDEVIRQYSRTPAADKARLLKADYLSIQGDYEGAQKAVAPVVEKGKPKSVVPLAYGALGRVQENAGKYQEAIKTYTAFLDKYAEHFMAPKIYESLGRVYELSNMPAEARSTYEKLATLFPASGWAQRAQERLQMLPQQAPGPNTTPIAPEPLKK